MSSRERILMWVGLGAAGFLVLFVGYAFLWAPLEDAWGRRATGETALDNAEKDLASQNRQNQAVLKLDPRLKLAEKISLPPEDPALAKLRIHPEDRQKRHESNMRGEYERYLGGVLRSAGYKPDSFTITNKKGESRSGAVKSKEPPMMEKLVFTVKARGPQDAAFRAMRDIHATPLLHVIRSFTLEVARPDSGTKKEDPNILQLDMEVEAVMVKWGEKRTTMMPSRLTEQHQVLAVPARDYTVLAKRSLFTGIKSPPPPPVKPPPPKKKEEKKEEPTGPSRDEILAVLEFVKVTMLAYNPERRRWEATLYDQAQGKGEEIKVDARLYKTFQITEGRTVMLDGKVSYIDEEQLIFESDGKFYRARVGDFLDVVWKTPLTAAEAGRYGLKK